MGCIIAPIVARLATSASPKRTPTDLTFMTSVGRIECTLDSDPRLIAAIGAIAAHAAQRIGLCQRDQENLAAAALDVCHEALPRLPKRKSKSTIKMVVADFSDRVELTIETPAGARAAGRSRATAGDKQAAIALVDRIERGTRDGHVYTTLVKYCAGVSSRSKS